MPPVLLTKKNLEEYCIEANERPETIARLSERFDLNQQRIRMALAAKNAPKPDNLASNKALFPMRRHKGWKYNIFHSTGKTGVTKLYIGIVFDRYRRPYYQTLSVDTVEKAIELARNIIDLLAKGQCVSVGFKLDEGKSIREKEEQTRNGNGGGKKS